MSAWPDNGACRGTARVVLTVIAKPNRPTMAVIIKSRRMEIYLLGDFRDPGMSFAAYSYIWSSVNRTLYPYIPGQLGSQHETLSTAAVGTMRRCAGSQVNLLRKILPRPLASPITQVQAASASRESNRCARSRTAQRADISPLDNQDEKRMLLLFARGKSNAQQTE